MQRIRKLVNYADPHHRILSDALLQAKYSVDCNIIQETHLKKRQKWLGFVQNYNAFWAQVFYEQTRHSRAVILLENKGK